MPSNSLLVGLTRVELAQAEPLRREVRDERVGFRVREHAADLALEHRRLRKLAGRGRREQRLVGDAAPEEERQARRELDVADAIDRPRRQIGRLGLEAEDELGIDEHARDGALNAGVERAFARGPAE